MSRWRLVLPAACAAMVVSGLGAMSAPAVGGSATVKATNSETWSPSKKSVPKGTRIVWKNPTGDDHDVTSYKGRWNKRSGLSEGSKTSYRFRRAGTYKYRCTRHSKLSSGKCSGMCGTIQVR